MVRPNSQNARILRALSDGGWHTTEEVRRKAGASCRVNSRISQLRSRGFSITTEKRPGRPYRYRLDERLPTALLERIASTPHIATAAVKALDRDEIPRDRDHRYRIYRVVFNDLELIATAATPGGVGVQIVALGQRGGFEKSCIGLLDTHGKTDEPGTWIVNPWDANV